MEPLKGWIKLLRGVAAALLFLGAVCPALLAAPASSPNSVEARVKAAFLAKFPAYIEWPAKAFESPTSPVQLCVIGSDEFGEFLDRAAASQRDARAIQVKRIKSGGAASNCHMVFLSGAEGGRLAQGLEGAGGQSVLTVTEDKGGSTQQGMIHFVIKDERVRFEVDDEAAAHAGITISSKLLSLALKVKPRKHKETK